MNLRQKTETELFAYTKSTAFLPSQLKTPAKIYSPLNVPTVLMSNCY